MFTPKRKGLIVGASLMRSMPASSPVHGGVDGRSYRLQCDSILASEAVAPRALDLFDRLQEEGGAVGESVETSEAGLELRGRLVMVSRLELGDQVPHGLEELLIRAEHDLASRRRAASDPEVADAHLGVVLQPGRGRLVLNHALLDQI